MPFPTSHYTRAANALRAYASRCAELSETLPDGEMRDDVLAEHSRTLRIAEDFERHVRQEQAVERDIIRQGCYGGGVAPLTVSGDDHGHDGFPL